MKAACRRVGYPVYRGTGPDDGATRLTVSVYLTREEHARCEGTASLRVRLEDGEPANTRAGVPAHGEVS